MGRKVKIGLVQVDLAAGGSYEERLDRLEALAEKCFADGAELVFFPEAYQYVGDNAIIYREKELAEKAAAWKERCARVAKAHNAYVVPWDYEVTEDGVYNTAYILDRAGREVGRFRKVHLPHNEYVQGTLRGDDFPVFDLDFGRVGIMICFDNYFPESARILGNRGAELVLYPLYGDMLIPQWELKLRARAVDNSMYIASCQIDSKFDVAWTGLVGPDGTVLHKLNSCPSHAVAEVEMGAHVKTFTNGNPAHLENIRAYLARSRNTAAYDGLLEAEKAPQSWDEIFYGNVPAVLTKEKWLDGQK